MDRVEDGSAVTLKYKMRSTLPDGTVTERPETEIEFIYGVEPQVPTLEKALHGASAGEKIHIQIPPQEIYGAHDPSLIKEIPIQGLIRNRLKQGQFYRQMKKGCLISFKVLEIRSHTVKADFNRPMAGITVSLDARVQAVRKASQKEIEAAREAHIKRSIGCG